jgi:hypothetical protein
MKATWVPTLFLGATLLSAPVFGQVSIGVQIGTPPPPVRYEVAPPPPPPPPVAEPVGFVWVAGYWAPQGGRYVWCPGRWMAPPDRDARWHAANWDRGDHGWRYREGYWEHRHDHDDHHGNGHAYGHYKHGHGHD